MRFIPTSNFRDSHEHRARTAKAEAGPKLAVISDIHSNLPALLAVLAEIDRLDIRQVICLGDIVGYGSRPGECLRHLRDRGIPCLRGNHDEMAASGLIPCGVSAGAEAGIHFTRKHLTRKDSAFLANLPWSLQMEIFSFVHASFPQPQEFDYLYGGEVAVTHLMQQPTRVSYFGHTHVQGGLLLRKGQLKEIETSRLYRIQATARSALNPGSVGQPRDGDPRAAFLVCQPATGQIEFLRIEYDVAAAIADMLKAGLPGYLAARLRTGT